MSWQQVVLGSVCMLAGAMVAVVVVWWLIAKNFMKFWN